MGNRKRTYLLPNYSSVFSIAFLVLLGKVHGASDEISPLITPTETDVTIALGKNVRFNCQSTEPIQWRFQEDFTGNYQIYDSFNAQANYPYQGILELIGVQNTYVGYYYCVKNTSQSNTSLDLLVTNNQASKIYLFVDDPEHPIAPANIPFIQGNQFEEVTVPCKPTSKKWGVQLIKDEDERHYFDSTYSPTDGYRIKLNEVTDGGYYICRSKLHNSSAFDVHFHVFMNAYESKFVNKPAIRSKTDDYGIEGEKLELDCTVEAQLGANFKIKWALPSNNLSLQEGRARIIEPIAHNHPKDGYYYAVGKLIVNNLDKFKDIGTYSCFVVDGTNIKKSTSLNVANILSARDSFIEIIEPAGKYSLKVTPKNREVKWIVEYRGYPTPKLMWYDNNGDEIPWSKQKGCKYEAVLEKNRAILKIRDIRVSDTGYYTLHADNGQMQKEQKFQLTVISMVKKRPVPISSTIDTQISACKNCKDVISRLNIAENQIKMLRLQLKEAKELNDHIRNEQVKYRDLFTNCSRETFNKH